MKRVVLCVALAALLGVAASAASAQTLNTIKQRGVLNCGANGTLAGFGLPGLAGPLGRPRRRVLQGARGRDLQRSEQGQVRAADREGPLHRAAIGRGRCAGAQHHLDLVARHLARPQLHRRQLLRRPGLPGAQGAEGEFGARAQRRGGLRAAGHHDRAQPRGLFPRQQDEAQDRDVRDRGRGAEGLRLQAAATPTPRTHPASPASGCGSPTPTITSSCRKSSPRSRSARWCATATTSGSTS